MIGHGSWRDRDACRSIRLAFEFLVLTATRSGEVRNDRWPEIDRDGAVWTIPGPAVRAGTHDAPMVPFPLMPAFA